MYDTLIHLSDIHIRIGDQDRSRYAEYNDMFTRLIHSIQLHDAIAEQRALIMITGDLFHHKNKLEPYALELAVHLLQGLAMLAPVYLIRGNHDYRQDLPHERDMISALMSYSIPHVTYLDQTGLHAVGNVTFGLVAIQDTLLYGATSGITSELPPFPDPSGVVVEDEDDDGDKEEEFRVALFHGTISGCTLHSTGPAPKGYPIDWFQGYDVILLGDIHVQQVRRAAAMGADDDAYGLGENTTHVQRFQYEKGIAPWAYPGSLIQQDFGETLFSHGFLVWNLADRSIDAYHLHNPSGWASVRRGNEVLHRDPITSIGSYVPLNTLVGAKWFPSMVRLAVPDQELGSVEMLRQHGKEGHVVKQVQSMIDEPQEETGADASDSKGMEQLNSMQVLMEYLRKNLNEQGCSSTIWESWLTHPERLLLPTDQLPLSIRSKIHEKGTKLAPLSRKYLEDMERVETHHCLSGELQLHHLEWSWILNYAKDNHLNFDTHQQQIAILNANNGHGKSNFLEVICIALFGEGFPSRHNKHYSSGIICSKKPDDQSPSTMIVFTFRDKRYALHRILKKREGRVSIDYVEVVLYVITAPCDPPLILHQGQTAVNHWIESNIGSCSAYLMSAMLSQNADSDFFSLDKKKQRELLDQVLSLDHIHSLQALLKASTLYFKGAQDLIEVCQTTKSVGIPRNQLLHYLESDKIAYQETVLMRDSTHAVWSVVSELSLNRIENFEDYCAQQKKMIDSLPSTPLDSINTVIQQKNTRIAWITERHKLIRSYLKEYDWAIKLDHHFGENIESEHGKLTVDQFLPILATYRRNVETHPLYDTMDRYAHIDNICDCAFNYPNREALEKEDHMVAVNDIKEFEMWDTIQQKQFGHIPDMDVDALRTQIADANTILTNTPALLKKLPLKRDQLNLANARAAKIAHLEKRPNLPSVDEVWLAAIEAEQAEYGPLERAEELMIRIDYHIKEIPVIHARIVHIHNQIEQYQRYLIECKDQPFNPKCKACKAQSWRVQYDQYLAELPTLQVAYKESLAALADLEEEEVPCKLCKDSVEEYLKEANIFRKWLAGYIDRITQWKKESTLSQQYAIWKAEYDQCCVKLTVAEKKYEKTCLAVKEYENAMHIASSSLPSLRSALEQSMQMDTYQKEREARYDAYLHNKKVLECRWHMCLYYYREAVTYLNDRLITEKKEYDAEEASLKAEIDALNAALHIHQRVQTHQSIIDVYPVWKKWKTYYQEEQQLRMRIQEKETMLRLSSDRADLDTDVLTIAKDNAELVEQLSGILDGYRRWVYTAHIAPLLQKRVNHILELVCFDHALSLDSEWLDTIDTLSWFIHDGTSRVVIEKASGFQRFMMGIAIRIAFHHIGFYRVRYDQLFIDEGFTACDARHLERVPMFLQHMLHFYNSIYLVTHLEDLKTSSPHHIHITRTENGLSLIRHGAVQPVLKGVNKADPPKRKGRTPTKK